MPDPIRITVPFDVARTSPNRRSLNSHVNTREKNAALEAARAAWKAAGSRRLNVPVNCRILVRRARVMDSDNCLASLKPQIDALFCARRFMADGGAITVDDSAHWLKITEVVQETAPEWKGREEIVFEVTPREEPPMALFEKGADGYVTLTSERPAPRDVLLSEALAGARAQAVAQGHDCGDWLLGVWWGCYCLSCGCGAHLLVRQVGVGWEIRGTARERECRK